jgi:hypothetical protein
MSAPNEPSVRTVTEIIKTGESDERDHDVTDILRASQRANESAEHRQIKIIIAKYLSVMRGLNLQQDLAATFSAPDLTNDVVAIIHSSLAFIHKRVNPMTTKFPAMRYKIVHDYKYGIPGEPLLFDMTEYDSYSEIGGIITCYVNRPEILRILSKDIDTTVAPVEPETRCDKLFNVFTKSSRREGDWREDDVPLTETHVTPYVSLLLLLEHAYLHFFVIKTFGLFNYSCSLVDHSIFVNRCRRAPGIEFQNMLSSKFSFFVESKIRNVTVERYTL